MASVQPDDSFDILVMGDFSGRGNRGTVMPLAGRKAVEIDRDNFDEVMESLAPSVRMEVDGAPVALQFHELDDFDPDRLHAKVPAFQESRPKVAGVPPASRPAETRPAKASSGSLLDAMLSEAEPAPAPPSDPLDAAADLRGLIDRAIAPHLVKAPAPEELRRVADEQSHSTGLMRGILHHPEFQQLEAAWRGLFFLVRRLDTGTDLKVFVLDVSRDELEADLLAHGAPASYTEIAQQRPWSVIAGNYRFGRSLNDLRLLAKLGTVGQAIEAPFLAEAATPGVDEGELQAWNILRASSAAKWIGLAMPRFLLRLPYGKDGASTDRLAFEEMGSIPRHEDYLWGNPAFACAYLLGEAFESAGWRMHPANVRDVTKLPVHVYTEGGDRVAKPCAEILMTEALADKLLAQGIMPLASMKHSDMAKLVRLQAIAEPLSPLMGRWG